jgi:glycosyltransferase involved in cell wall biosynthesis
VTADKLRILQVMRAPVGGLFRHVADLTRELAAKGHAVGLVVDSLATDTQTEGKLAALLPHAELGIHRFAMPRVLGPGDLRTPLAVRRLLQSLDIDVVHGHGAKGGFYSRLSRIGSKAAALYTPHGGVLHFSKTSLSGRMFHALERALMAQTGAIVFESAYARNTYAALIGAPTCPVEVIHNGLAPDEFVPVVASPDAADFVFVGELRGLKGIHDLINALQTVTRVDGTAATLVIAGDGPDRGALEAQIASLGLRERVTLLGAQPARPTFALGRVAVLPSLAESLPYIVLEAIAARLPVITTRVGGIPEIFGPVANLLVERGNVGALRAAMQQALGDPEAERVRMAPLLPHVADNFSLSRMSSSIEALYQSVLTRP